MAQFFLFSSITVKKYQPDTMIISTQVRRVAYMLVVSTVITVETVENSSYTFRYNVEERIPLAYLIATLLRIISR